MRYKEIRARDLLTAEIGDVPDGTAVGIAIWSRTAVVAAVSNGDLILIPVEPLIPVRRVSEGVSIRLPAGSITVTEIPHNLLYRKFDVRRGDSITRISIAKRWGSLIAAIRKLH